GAGRQLLRKLRLTAQLRLRRDREGVGAVRSLVAQIADEIRRGRLTPRELITHAELVVAHAVAVRVEDIVRDRVLQVLTRARGVLAVHIGRLDLELETMREAHTGR